MSLTRRGALIGGIGLAAAGLGALVTRTQTRPRLRVAPARERPNLLLIVTDQERARHLLPAAVRLPQRDRLMARSTVFRQAMTTSNLCSTARGTLYSGQHPQNNGLWENAPLPYAPPLAPHVPTLGSLLQDVGYHTAYFGKWHLSRVPTRHGSGERGMRELLRAYGFETSAQDGERDGTHHGHIHDPSTARTSARFVHAAADQERPWFAAVNFVNPHDVMFFSTGPEQVRSRLSPFPDRVLPAPDDALYRTPLDVDLPDTFGPATLAGKPAAHTAFQQVWDLALGRIPFDDRDAWRAYWHYYLHCLQDVDRHLQTVLDAVRDSGQGDRTVIVFTSDHGEMGGVHGLRDKGASLYREASQVPLWIAHPEVEGGSSTDALSSHVDLVPTLLRLAGVEGSVLREQAPYLIGTDLTPALSRSADRGLEATGRDAVLSQWTSLVHQSPEAARAFDDVSERGLVGKAGLLRDERVWTALDARGQMRGLFDGRFKFARYFSPRRHHTPRDFETLVADNDLELYDTDLDPGETTNLAVHPERHRQRLEALSARLDQLVAREVGTDDGRHYPFWQA
ncbi:MAG: sulfatase-like hydrolase/transferase [Myxococcota bacterium]